jgi:hypothetical protein
MQFFTFNQVKTTFLLTVATLSLSSFSPEHIATVKVNSTEDEYRAGMAGVAQNYLGIPYILGARGPKSFDCSGFTSYIFNEFSAVMEPQAAAQAQLGESVSLSEVRPSDLVFFGSRNHVKHVALVVGRNADGITVVHCTTSRGVIVENITQSHYWSPKILFARNVVNRFFEFAPSSIFNSIAAPLLAKAETAQIQVMQAVAAVANGATNANSSTAAAINAPVSNSKPAETSSYNYSAQYKSTINERSSYSRTYGHTSSDADDADADNDEGGQN